MRRSPVLQLVEGMREQRRGKHHLNNAIYCTHFPTQPLEVFTPMSQRVICPLIPSSHLSKGWKPAFLKERVGALLLNASGKDSMICLVF